jgi:hypothetical protein
MTKTKKQIKKVANFSGYNYYIGTDEKGKTFYNIGPETEGTPAGGYYSKEYILKVKQLPDLF